MKRLALMCKSAIVDRLAPSRQAADRGQMAEQMAEAHLNAAGLHTLARNFHCRGGELDLVCREGKTLVFVEVRLRGRSDFGGAAASITLRKQARIALAARHWLARAGRLADAPCRFDVVLLDALDSERIEWIRGAFDSG
ncbi:YraN family protein [Denitromonas sp.]|uniref:YraN family protein n=1 Tax=Denitromonas sp. TaxID=2734609 RepID=UPI001DF5F34B|nr:YraN family protein [Rhodocyclaceae bacterium]